MPMPDDFNSNLPEPIECICPVCGSEEYCMAFDESGYCPADGPPLDHNTTITTSERN